MTKKLQKIQPRTPSGFPELLPADQIIFNWMTDKIRSVYESFGYLPIETPAVELKEVLLAKGGGDTEKQVYRLYAGEVETDMCLHFDLTVPLARYVAEHIDDLALPFRRYQMQKVWRGERAQRGRFREFYQFDIDVIGSSGSLIDAEIPTVIYNVFTKLGLNDFVISIGHRKLFTGYFDMLSIDISHDIVMRWIDKLDKVDAGEVTIALRDEGLTDDQIRKIFEFIKISGTNREVLSALAEIPDQNDLFREGLLGLQAIREAMLLLGVPEKNFKLDISIVRGLDYYTGVIYETKLTNYPEIGSICSGGRYDDLCSYYTDRDLPGVGISIGMSRLFYQLKQAGLLPKLNRSTSRVLVAIADETGRDWALTVAALLRKADINCEVYPDMDKLKKQFSYADKLGVPYVLVVGGNEAKDKMVTFKDMATSTQTSVTLEKSIAMINWDHNHMN